MTVYGPYDLNAWGGLLAYANPDPLSGQGMMRYLSSPDGLVLTEVVRYPIWPSAPFTLNLPRVDRYGHIAIDPAPSIPSENQVLGVFGARATISEVLSAVFTPFGTAPVVNFSVPAGGSASYIVYTPGVPALQLALRWLTFTAGEYTTIGVETTNSLIGTPIWSYQTSFIRTLRANTGEQSWSGTINRLESYARITITNNGTATQSGTLIYRARTTPDPSTELTNVRAFTVKQAISASTATKVLSNLPTPSQIVGLWYYDNSGANHELSIDLGDASTNNGGVVYRAYTNGLNLPPAQGFQAGLLIPADKNNLYVFSGAATTIYVTLWLK